MADVHLECDACKGKRFKKEVLEVQFHKNSHHYRNTTGKK